MLARAIYIAFEAHKGQFDKSGQPYIRHPMRVMERMDTEYRRMVAVLHDVVEDCEDWTLQRLLDEGFPQEVVDGVDAITKRAGEHNDDYIRRVYDNSLARSVKLADIEDNLDMTRMPGLSDKDHRRIDKYIRNRLTLLYGFPGAAKDS